MSAKEKVDDLVVVAGDVLPTLDDRSDSGDSIFTATDERRLVKKQDWRVLPFVCAMYLLAGKRALCNHLRAADLIAL